MGWTYIGYCKNYNVASGTTLAGDAVLDVQAGDLLVAICEWYGSGLTPSVSDGAGNDLAILDHKVDSYYPVYAAYGYKMAAVASPSATFVYTHAAAQTYRGFIVLQFRPTAGTVELDAYNYDAAWDGVTEDPDIQSNAISTTGSDELIIGGHAASGSDNSSSISAAKIATLAADGVPWPDNYYPHLWYKAFTSAQSNIYSQATASQPIKWFAAGILAFKLTGGTTYTLTCEPGAFALAGEAIAPKAIRRIALSPGALSLSGQPVGLRASRRTIAGAGVFSLQGQPIGLKAARRLSAAPGAFALAGLPAFLRRVARLVLGPGAFALTGQDVDLRLGGAVPVIPTLHISPWRYTPAQKIRLRAHATLSPFEVTNTIRIPGGSS